MIVPASPAEALDRLQALVGYLADLDAASLPAEVLAQLLLGMEQADSVWTVAWARSLGAFDAQHGHQADGRDAADLAGCTRPASPGARPPSTWRSGR